MSLLIKGMEMPKSCGDCRFCDGIADTDCGPCAWCDVDGKARVADTRQDCPLVPVPPHGRLGDLDALAESVRNPGIFPPVVSSEVLAFLRNAPTIIEAEGEKK